MKKIILVFSLAALSGLCLAQVTVPETNPVKPATVPKDFVRPPAIGDIGKTTTSIVDMLGTKLSLPDVQKPKLTDAISGFLTQKKDIIGLANTNPTDYLSKFNPLQKGLFGKLKGIMGASAFTKFLGLKPSGKNIAGDVLSNLFF